MPRQPPIEPEQPRSEPEIIPPARGRSQAYGAGAEWFSMGQHGSSRVYSAKLGPWSLLGMVLLFGLVVGAVLAVVLGALLIAIPIIGLLVAGAVISGAVRAHLRRPR